MDKLLEVQEALSQFVIDTAKNKNPGNAVQVLPEAVKVLIDLNKFTRNLLRGRCEGE
ncbi:hypothetical protein [Pelosinus propionicus]|uniref:Uncharacterized protein n=1 Tax=Pelosinus propionicus DSM 13327 TaxID=1123291 RepID=A0A1I4N3M0_9FIRM|nr:hypothetical protein [Pelosinus propionicus]SFM09927.1 hypothetical protein SAMN04490355_104075 [Pelosinus propionicus DSM 13327]